MRFRKENALAVQIDVQERLFPHIHEHDHLAKRSAILLKGLQALDVPIIATEQYVKGLGETIPELKEHMSEIDTFEKMTFSCCGNEDFMDALFKTKRKEIILFGIETHVCVLQTCIDMLNRDLKVMVITDCVSSRKQSDKEIALRRMEQEGAFLGTSESILFELCKEAGSDTFKQISKLVK